MGEVVGVRVVLDGSSFNQEAPRLGRSLAEIKTSLADLERQMLRVSKTPSLRTDAAGAARSLAAIKAENRALQENVTALRQGAGAVTALANQREIMNRLLTVGVTRESAYGRQIEAQIRTQQRLRGELQQLNTVQGRAGSGMGSLGSITTRAAGAFAAFGVSVYGAVNALRAGVSAAEDYDRSLTKILNLTDVSAAQLRGWEARLKSIAAETGRMPAAVVGGLTAVTSAGIVSEEAMRATEAASKAAAIGLGEVDVIARVVAAAVTAYGPEVLSAAEATDQLLAIVRVGAAEADTMAGALGRVLGPANQLGVSFAEVGGFVATFTRLGIDANEAVTALGGVFATLIGPTKDQQEALALIGKDLQGLREEIREKGLATALNDLAAAFSGMEGGEDMLARIIPNVRALRGFLGVTGAQAKAFVQSERDIENATGDLERAMVEWGKSTSGQLDMMRSDLSLMKQEMGEELLPVMLDVANAARDMFSGGAVDNANQFATVLGWIVLRLKDYVELWDRLSILHWLKQSRDASAAAIDLDLRMINLEGSANRFVRVMQESGGRVNDSMLRQAWDDAKGLATALNEAQSRLDALRSKYTRTSQITGQAEFRMPTSRPDREALVQAETEVRRLTAAYEPLKAALRGVQKPYADINLELDAMAHKTGPPGGLSDKQQRLIDQYFKTTAALALQAKQEREIQALMLSMPYRQVEAALKRLAIEHEVQRTVLEAEAKFMELGAAKAREMAFALGEQTRQTLTAKLATEDLNDALAAAVRITDELSKGRVKLSEDLRVPAFERGSLPWAVTTKEDVQLSAAHRADLDAVLDIMRDLKTPAEQYRAEVAEVERLMAKFPVYAEQLQAHLVRMAQEWNGYRTIMTGALRSTADLARDVFAEIISGGEVSWRSVADSLIRIWADAMANLLAQWIANLVRMKAAESAAGLGSSASAGSATGGMGMSGGLFAGMGRWAMGNPMTGSQWGLSSGAYAAIFAAVAAVIINQIRTSGRAHSRIDLDIGGGGLGISSTSGGWNTNTTAATLRSNIAAATGIIKAVNEFIREIGAEFDRTSQAASTIGIGRTGRSRKTNWYVTYGAGLVKNFGRDLEAALEFGAVQAIKQSPLTGLDPIVSRAISKSMAETMDALRADIALATEVVNAGLSPIEIDIKSIAPRFDDLRDRITSLLGPSEELTEALSRLAAAETRAWQDARDAITGRERTAEEDYQDRLRQAKMFNAELALRKLDIQLAIDEIRIRIERLRSGVTFNRGLREETGLFIENGRGFLRAVGGLAIGVGAAAGMSQEFLDAQIARLEEQERRFREWEQNLPDPIDPSEVLRRPRGGGRGDRADEREALRREAARFGLNEVASALRDAADRHREYAERVREAGLRGAEAADLIRKSEEELARERERIVRDQRRASGDFILRGTPFGGDLLGGIAQINAEMNRLLEGNRALVAEGQLSIREMRELNNAIREAGERQRQALGRQAELGLLGELYGLLGMTEEAARLEWELKLAGLKIAYEELRIAAEIYNLNLTYLEEIAGLIGEFERIGPPTTAPTVPERTARQDDRPEQLARIRQEIRETFEDILKGLLAFRDSLLLDERLSPLTPQQRVAEALRQYEEIQALAAGGDVEALRGRDAAARTYLAEMQAAYGSTAPYQEAFQRVMADTTGLITDIERLRENATEMAIRELGLNVLDFANRNQGSLSRIIDNTDPTLLRHVVVDNLPPTTPQTPGGGDSALIPFVPRTVAGGATYAYAEGGIAYTPQVASLAERGPEIVLPLGAVPSGGGDGSGDVVKAVDKAGLETARQLVALARKVEALARALDAERADRQKLQRTLERALSGDDTQKRKAEAA